jgi:Alpha/beta hydrolase of unknown function (DUF900)
MFRIELKIQERHFFLKQNNLRMAAMNFRKSDQTRNILAVSSSFAASMVISLMISSCGARHEGSNSKTLAARQPPKPLLIGLSGFSTCSASDTHYGDIGPAGSTIFNRGMVAAGQIKDTLGVEPEVIMTCFTSNGVLIESTSSSQWHVTWPTEAEFLTSLQEQMAQATHIYVVGHSYGGWLGMKLVDSWSGDPNVIKSLFTIDPISKSRCSVTRPIGCLRAPPDIDTAARQHIKDVTEVWENPWQSTTLFLHSSAIAEADSNPFFRAEHWEVNNEESIWTDFHGQVRL